MQFKVTTLLNGNGQFAQIQFTAMRRSKKANNLLQMYTFPSSILINANTITLMIPIYHPVNQHFQTTNPLWTLYKHSQKDLYKIQSSLKTCTITFIYLTSSQIVALHYNYTYLPNRAHAKLEISVKLMPQQDKGKLK